MKLISIVGTRPQFLKLIPLVKEINSHSDIQHKILNTGQHFDSEMSSDIFSIFNISKPYYQLGINSGSHGKNTGLMLIEIEKILLNEKPDYTLVYGDCDTTLAGCIASVKLGILTVHIEAGLRSFNKTMPEEINRIAVDHMANILCCPTQTAINNLKNEGITSSVYLTGNLQLDLLKMCIDMYTNQDIMCKNKLEKDQYILLTIHRHYNTTKDKLKDIFSQLKEVDYKIFFPLHPRTKKVITANNITVPNNIIISSPVNYPDMTILERNCKVIITDSGGVQPEAYYLGKQCITIRPETEWIETVESGLNTLVDSKSGIKECIEFKKGKVSVKKELNCSKEIINIIV